MLVISLICMIDIVDIALYVCRLLLYNNFKRLGNVTCQCLFNVPNVTLFL